jgi:DNA-binding transcriptional LysR family regulator
MDQQRRASPANRIRFDLVTIRLFIAVARHGSVTRAAAEQCLAIAAASRRISELEAQVGLALFERRPHGMALTDAGRSLLVHARSMAMAVDRMQDEAAAYLHGDKGVVRIAACTSAVLQFLPDDIAAFRAAHPDIHIDLHESSSNAVVQAVARGEANLGIYESSAGATPEASLPYRGDELTLVTSPRHALARLPAVRIEQILQHPIVGLPESTSLSSLLRRMAETHGMRLQTPIRVNSFDSMLAMIRSGMGIGLVPKDVAALFANREYFHQVAIDGAWARRSFRICHQPSELMPYAAATCVAFLSGLHSQNAKAGS